MFDSFVAKFHFIELNSFHNINFKKNKHFQLKLNLGLIHQNCFSLIFSYFSMDLMKVYDWSKMKVFLTRFIKNLSFEPILALKAQVIQK